MRIGLISDTHMPRGNRRIPDAVLEGLAGVDLILHAGDLVASTASGTGGRWP